MRRRTITISGALVVLLLALLGRTAIPDARPARAQQGGGDNAAVVEQLTLLNTKTGQLNQGLTQLNGKTDQLSTKADQLNSKTDQLNGKADQLNQQLTQLNGKADQLNTETDQVNQQLTQLNTKTDQVIKELEGVAKQTERIADRLEMHTVAGVGYVEVTVPADRAVVQLDVKSLAPTLDAAIAQNQSAVAAMKTRIGAAPIGVADSQIAPVLGDERLITGYRVLTPLLVTIEKPSGAGAGILAQLVRLGGNSFGEIKYSVDEATAKQAQDKGRAQAFDLAKAHAQVYATKAGGTLGAIQSISEDVNSRTYRQLPLPGEPTEQVVTVGVSVVFELVGP